VYFPVNSKNGLINFVFSIFSFVFHTLFLVFLWYIIRKCNILEYELEKNEIKKNKLMKMEYEKLEKTHNNLKKND